MLNFPSFFNAQAGGYEIKQSLRSDADNQNLKRTPATSGNKQTWTWSGWIKRGELGAEQHFFESWEGTGDVMTYARFHSNDTIRVKQFQSGDIFELQTNAVFRDPSAWYHVVLSFDTTQATSSDRAKIYVNGELQSLGTANYPSQNLETFVNQSGYIHHLFADLYTSSRSFNGYMAEVHLIDGTALDPTSFGETNNDGVWVPVAYTGSHGTEGWYMKFDETATNGIGHDHSGNGNNLTSSNFTTSGTGTDVFSDTPTTNWSTWNPINSSASISLTEGNLKFGQSSNDQVSIGTQSMTSGKYYWEIDKNSGENPEIGIIPDTASVSNQSTPSATAFNQIAFITNSSNTIRNGNGGNETVSGLSAQTGAGTIGIAVDMDNHKIWWSDTSGNWFNSGDPAAGTNEAKDFTGLDCANGCMPYIYMGTGSSHTAIANFGQRDFAYTPPTGFKALNTSNLSAPTVKDGSQHFNTVLWTGNGTSQSISTVGFQPDFVWEKTRNDSSNHWLTDAIRGTNKILSSSLSDSETTNNNSIQSFDSNGFTVGSDGAFNGSGITCVAWNWLASNTSGSSNTDGSITSTVSVNPDAGFSIVTYNGSAQNDTVGHGLGVAPNLIIFKRRNAATSWPVYHSTISPSNVLYLNETVGQASSGNSFGSTPTAPTSSVFSVGDKGDTNYGTMVAYCFAEVENYSRIGTYTANNSSDGPFVYCGFKPALVLLRSYNGSTGRDWLLYDSTRSTYNNERGALVPNVSNAESSYDDATYRAIDFLSNGFKLRTNGTPNMNASSESYIFMALAENPFGGSGVSPATAR